MTEPLFGTDGIRGLANAEPLTPPTLARIGRAIGETLRARGGRPRALIGRDTRISGPMVGGAVLSGLLSAGVDVFVAGVLPTPGVARLAMARRCGIGVVVSASHNPAPDNGVKVFLGDGRKAGDGFAAEVEARSEQPPEPAEPGRYEALPHAVDDYVDLLVADFEGLSLGGTRIVVDAANGAMCEAAPRALARLGAEVVATHDRPNGKNINLRCGALHPEAMARAVVRARAAVGVSFDGDGDRAIFSDETGRVLDGDAVMAILARDLLARRRLPKRRVTSTVMSNLGLEISLREIGVELVRTPVGDRFVTEEMERDGTALGGEQSGHLIVRQGRRLLGDGLDTTLHLLAARARARTSLSALGECFSRAPQTLLNVSVAKKPNLLRVPGVKAAVREAEASLAGEGRIVLRYSGTESLARVMVEAPDLPRARAAARRIASIIEAQIGSTS